MTKRVFLKHTADPKVKSALFLSRAWSAVGQRAVALPDGDYCDTSFGFQSSQTLVLPSARMKSRWFSFIFYCESFFRSEQTCYCRAGNEWQQEKKRNKPQEKYPRSWSSREIIMCFG